MLFTKSTAYTLQALVELSKFDKPVDVAKLSELTELPKPFLAKLLQTLSKKGFIKSFKGIHGGFLLAKDPEDIKIVDIFKALEDKDSFVFYCSSNKQNCTRERADVCILQPFFAKLEDEIYEIMKKYRLSDVIRMESGKA
ncbi:MAG: Rrf2 family transcriptional regulator [Epsilonproteobacteria bacterium]|nr:Rrf2 family transcriptional regulator [Campylobacterota bacterium]